MVVAIIDNVLWPLISHRFYREGRERDKGIPIMIARKRNLGRSIIGRS